MVYYVENFTSLGPFDFTAWNTLSCTVQGDIWAESSMMGLLVMYYACMDGAVYQITQWASCQVTLYFYLCFVVLFIIIVR